MKSTNLLISLSDYGMLMHVLQQLCYIHHKLGIPREQFGDHDKCFDSHLRILNRLLDSASDDLDIVLQGIDILNGKEVDSNVPSSNSTQLRDCPDGEDIPF